MRASQLMTRDVYFVNPDEDLASIWTTMKMLGIRHVPVIERSKLVGMISDRDILAHATLNQRSLVVPELHARAVMASPVVTCLISDALSAVGDKMLANKIDSVVIVNDEGELAGLVTSTGSIHLALDREAHDLRSPPPYEFHLQRLRP